MIFFKVTSFFAVLVSIIAVSVADQNTNFENPLGEVLGSIVTTISNKISDGMPPTTSNQGQNNPNSPNTTPTMPNTQNQQVPMNQVPIAPPSFPMHPAVALSNNNHHPMNNIPVLVEQLHNQVQNAVASSIRLNHSSSSNSLKNVDQGIIIFNFILNMSLCSKCLMFCS